MLGWLDILICSDEVTGNRTRLLGVDCDRSVERVIRHGMPQSPSQFATLVLNDAVDRGDNLSSSLDEHSELPETEGSYGEYSGTKTLRAIADIDVWLS